MSDMGDKGQKGHKGGADGLGARADEGAGHGMGPAHEKSYLKGDGKSQIPQPILPRPGIGGGPGFGGSAGRRFMTEKVKAKDARRTLQRIWVYLKRQKAALIGVFALVLISSLLALAGPYLIGMGVDAMAAGPGKVDFKEIMRVCVLLALSYIGNAVASWLAIYVMSAVAVRTVKELRRDLFDKVQRLPVPYFDSQPHGELMSRLINDVDNVNNTLASGVTQVFSSAITVAGSFAMMLYLSPLLTALSLAAVPLSILATGLIAKRTRRYFSRQARDLGELNGFIEETISGQKVVKAFSREEPSKAEFGVISERLRRSGLMAQIYSGLIPRIMIVVNNLSYALCAVTGGALVIRGAITVGLVASFLNYSRQFARPINEIANQYNQLQSAIAGAERVFEVMDEKEEDVSGTSGIEAGSISGEVRFNDVDFSYKKGTPVLRDVDIEADAGRTVALVGPTGAGKTTVVNLLMRFYDADDGMIEVDGTDIRQFDRQSLRRSIGIVLQDTYLFSESVKENIRYGRLDATDEEVVAAARTANADTFIRRLPEGYDTVLNEDGGNLSQGQRQLIAIARAVLADPSILILDEATSSVDTRTEVYIQKAMLELMKGRTSFVIAHRLSTIKGADEILVIRDGRIIERGDHRRLMELKGFYYGLYASQFRRHEALSAGI